MAIKINNTTIIDDSRNIVNAGVVTATSFSGSGVGLTGVSGIASNTSINTSGIVTASGFVGNVTGNVTGNLTGTASTATAAATSFGLTGSPNVTVGVLTATTISTGSTTGTSGQVLQSTGTGVTWKDPAAGGFSNMQVFTSPGTFTVPSTTTKVKVIVTGGGGLNSPPSYASGGAGGTGIALINVSPSTSVPITTGAASDSNTTQGGSSTFGTFVTATGGYPGIWPDLSVRTGGGSATFPEPSPNYQSSVTISGGTGNLLGGPGGTLGGSSYWGGPSAYGAGGGVNGVAAAPKTAQSGIVIVEW
jgi:hypothetical protein